jgi:hypothetical protein
MTTSTEHVPSNERCEHSPLLTHDSVLRSYRAPCPWCKDDEIERLEIELAYWKARSGVAHGPETDAFKRSAHEPPVAPQPCICPYCQQPHGVNAKGASPPPGAVAPECERSCWLKDSYEAIEVGGEPLPSRRVPPPDVRDELLREWLHVFGSTNDLSTRTRSALTKGSDHA